MLVKYLIAVQLGLKEYCLLLDKHILNLYKYISIESTKRNVYRYSEVVHTLWLQDYPFICSYTVNMCYYKLWY